MRDGFETLRQIWSASDLSDVYFYSPTQMLTTDEASETNVMQVCRERAVEAAGFAFDGSPYFKRAVLLLDLRGLEHMPDETGDAPDGARCAPKRLVTCDRILGYWYDECSLTSWHALLWELISTCDCHGRKSEAQRLLSKRALPKLEEACDNYERLREMPFLPSSAGLARCWDRAKDVLVEFNETQAIAC